MAKKTIKMTTIEREDVVDMFKAICSDFIGKDYQLIMKQMSITPDKLGEPHNIISLCKRHNIEINITVFHEPKADNTKELAAKQVKEESKEIKKVEEPIKVTEKEKPAENLEDTLPF